MYGLDRLVGSPFQALHVGLRKKYPLSAIIPVGADIRDHLVDQGLHLLLVVGACTVLGHDQLTPTVTATCAL
jgi:hypothetical protein